MPRKCGSCGTGTVDPALGCQCGVVAGTNTTVTGTGSAGDPFIINATTQQTVVTAGTNITVTGTGATATPYVVNATAGNNATVAAGPLTGQSTITFANADTLVVTVPCSVAGPGGATGTQNGVFVDACATAALGGSDPATAGFDPTTFPEWWRQAFTGGTTGAETWIIQLDVLGAKQWHQIT